MSGSVHSHLLATRWFLERNRDRTSVAEIRAEFDLDESTARRWLKALVKVGLAVESSEPPQGKHRSGKELYYVRTVFQIAQLPNQVRSSDLSPK